VPEAAALGSLRWRSAAWASSASSTPTKLTKSTAVGAEARGVCEPLAPASPIADASAAKTGSVWRLQLCRVGTSRNRVRDHRRTFSRQLDRLGRHGSRLAGFLGAWEEFHAEADEYRELDQERVLVLVHQGGRGKASGLELGQMETKAAHVFQIRGGKVTRLVRYWDRERAFVDLGLQSETAER
jgi:hypothetical protein